MKMYRCTYSTYSYLCYATVIAENERHATEMAALRLTEYVASGLQYGGW